LPQNKVANSSKYIFVERLHQSQTNVYYLDILLLQVFSSSSHDRVVFLTDAKRTYNAVQHGSM